jgi:hypothetical protein
LKEDSWASLPLSLWTRAWPYWCNRTEIFQLHGQELDCWTEWENYQLQRR